MVQGAETVGSEVTITYKPVIPIFPTEPRQPRSDLRIPKQEFLPQQVPSESWYLHSPAEFYNHEQFIKPSPEQSLFLWQRKLNLQQSSSLQQWKFIPSWVYFSKSADLPTEYLSSPQSHSPAGLFSDRVSSGRMFSSRMDVNPQLIIFGHYPQRKRRTQLLILSSNSPGFIFPS